MKHVASKQRLQEATRTLTRILRGEITSMDDLPDVDPRYDCRFCKDTGFEIVETDRGPASRRCKFCKDRFDARVRAENRDRPTSAAPVAEIEDPPPSKLFEEDYRWED